MQIILNYVHVFKSKKIFFFTLYPLSTAYNVMFVGEVFRRPWKADSACIPDGGRNSELLSQGSPAPGLSGPEHLHDPCSYHLGTRRQQHFHHLVWWNLLCCITFRWTGLVIIEAVISLVCRYKQTVRHITDNATFLFICMSLHYGSFDMIWYVLSW